MNTSSKYSKRFFIPLPESKIDTAYINSLDPEEDAEEIFSHTHQLAYSTHGARIRQYIHSEFVLMEVLVHLYKTGFIRPL